jgi:hypothetical protein
MVVLEGPVPAAVYDAVARDMFHYVGASPANPASWYTERPAGKTRFGVPTSENSMLNMWHTQSMWDLRTQPRIHAAMAELIE